MARAAPPPTRPAGPPRLLRGLFVAALALVAGTWLLPWVVSGETTRDSFSIVRSARALDVVGGGPADAALALWYVVPLWAAIAFLLAVRQRWRWSAAAATGVAGATMVLGLLTALAPVERSYGVPLAIGAGVVLAVAALAMAVRAGH